MELTKDSIEEILKDLSLKYTEYNEKLLEKRREVIKIYAMIDEKYREKYIFYRTEFQINLKHSEARDLVEKDPDIVQLRKKAKEIESEIKYYENEIKNLEGLRWDIKNFIDWKKIEFGL